MRLFIIYAIFFSSSVFNLQAQNARTDSLKQLLKAQPPDTNRVNLFLRLAGDYFFSKPDTCLFYTKQALQLSESLKYTKGKVAALNYSGEALRFLGDFPLALKMQIEALGINREMKDLDGEAGSLGFIGLTYVELKEYRIGLRYLMQSVELNKQVSNQIKETFDLTNIGNAYDMLGMADSALYYQQLAMRSYEGLKHGPLKSLIISRYGNAFARKGLNDSAMIYFHKALENAIAVNDRVNNGKIQGAIAELYETSGRYDSSLYYAQHAFVNSRLSTQSLGILQISNLLVRLFRKSNKLDSAFYYEDIAKTMSDRLYGPQKFRELQLLMLQEQQREEKNIRQQEDYRNRIKYIILLSAVGVFLLLAFILFRNNKHKQKANILLENQNTKIEHTLAELRATQSQLIQSEKMASLGELTAGIAHEIQNPLNFVNNFSEVSKELLDEMKIAIDGNQTEAAKEIADDVANNLEKINHHGKRASEIIKGMLQHSYNGSGTKSDVDINKLTDEYVRLAFHGMRSKDKSFNTTLKTDFDESIGTVNVVPQDMGRAILNLITNAFYAVTQKKKHHADGYEPVVSITTKKTKGKIEIIVRDNGNGVPEKIADKIFQPFFTTKPTGEGTGLGLFISYDIVKANGGELTVKNKEGEGAEFIITLPD